MRQNSKLLEETFLFVSLLNTGGRLTPDILQTLPGKRASREGYTPYFYREMLQLILYPADIVVHHTHKVKHMHTHTHRASTDG